MRLHRFYIHETIGNKKELLLPDDKLAHQLRNVFRLKVGDGIILFDGSDFEYVSSITNLSNDKVEVMIKEKHQSRVSPSRKVHIFQSLIKKDNFEWVLEKCTEVGVSEFTPVISERTEKKSFNIERAEKILIEASEQSGRCSIPILSGMVTLSEIVKKYGKDLIAFHLDGEKFEILRITNRYESTNEDIKRKNPEVKVLIGPEGGWSEKEIALMRQNGVKIYSLGNQILRSETAAVAVATLLLL